MRQVLMGLLFFGLIFISCGKDDTNACQTAEVKFVESGVVEVQAYSGNIMEPFISRDGSILMFNNLNAAPENTNLHWATWVNDSSFNYQGEMLGVNTQSLEGVPTMDEAGKLYFVSTRSYATSLSTIYQCDFASGLGTDVQLVSGLSRLTPGLLNFDVEVSADGQNLYFVDGQFDQSGVPLVADIAVAQKSSGAFKRLVNSDDIMKHVNTKELEYAACISRNQLELYFTRVNAPLNASSVPELYLATRANKSQPFCIPRKIEGISGFVEAITIAPDQRTIFYHKRVNNQFYLYRARRQ